MSLCKIKDFIINFSDKRTIVKIIENLIKQNRTSQIVTLNLLMYLWSKKDKKTYNAIKNAALVIPDSIGITFFGSILLRKKVMRIPGIDLLITLCELSKEKGYKIYLLGSKENIVEHAAGVIKKKYGANIVGFHHGYFKDDGNKVVEEINKLCPDIIFVGLELKNQENWIFKNLKSINAKVIMGVGGSFDVISGKLLRAPKLFMVLGLEWFFRLVQQPWRIFRILNLPLAFTMVFFDVIYDSKVLKI